MKTIWKYELQIIDQTNILMPKGAKIFSAREQRGSLCIWALVDDKIKVLSDFGQSQEKDTEYKSIYVVGTGNPFPILEQKETYLKVLKFIDTVVMSNGLVWHVFEEIHE